MNIVPTVIGRTVARNVLNMQKNSPGILFGAGIVGMLGSTVLACRATLKMEEVLGDAEVKREMVDRALIEEPEKYSEKDGKKDLKLIRVQTGVKIVRLYAPAIIIGGVSIAALTRSHNILTSRNAALTAAYAVLEKGFNEYRARVVEKYGEEQDRDFRFATEKVEIDNPETGKKEMVTRIAPGDPSIYSRFFDEGSSNWQKGFPEHNLFFLKAQQNYFNDLLHARGHVFLNEVYDALDLPRSGAGAVVGWVLSRNGETDNYISFGVFDGKTDIARDFVNGREGAILLDFNVDGLIYDKIDELRKELSWRRRH